MCLNEDYIHIEHQLIIIFSSHVGCHTVKKQQTPPAEKDIKLAHKSIG